MVSRIFLSSIDFSRSSTGDFSYDFNLSSKPPPFFLFWVGFKLFVGSVRNIDIIGVGLEIDFMLGICFSAPAFLRLVFFTPFPSPKRGR